MDLLKHWKGRKGKNRVMTEQEIRRTAIEEWIKRNVRIVDSFAELAPGEIGIMKHGGPLAHLGATADYFVPVKDGKILCRMLEWHNEPDRPRIPTPWFSSPVLELEFKCVADYVSNPERNDLVWLTCAELTEQSHV